MARFTKRPSQVALYSGWRTLKPQVDEWDKCDLYLPKSISKKLVQHISMANTILVKMEIYGQNIGAILPGMGKLRCEQFAELVKLVTNTKESCQECVQRGPKRKPKWVSVVDPKCK